MANVKRKRSLLLISSAIALAACDHPEVTNKLERCKAQVESGLIPDFIQECRGYDVFTTGGLMDDIQRDNLNIQLAESWGLNSDRSAEKTESGTTARHTPVFVWIYSGGSAPGAMPLTSTSSAPIITRGTASSFRAPVSPTVARSGFGSVARGGTFSSSSST